LRTSKIATLDKTLAKGLLGMLNTSEMEMLNINLKEIFQLN